MPNSRIEEAIALMNDFAVRTGISSKQPPRRYLGVRNAPGRYQYPVALVWRFEPSCMPTPLTA